MGMVIEVVPEVPEATGPESLVPTSPVVDDLQSTWRRTVHPPTPHGPSHNQACVQEHA